MCMYMCVLYVHVHVVYVYMPLLLPLLPPLPSSSSSSPLPPSHQWIDKIRTPRASNEARQRIFSKLSGELQRKIGLKALEAGGNAVIG